MSVRVLRKALLTETTANNFKLQRKEKDNQILQLYEYRRRWFKDCFQGKYGSHCCRDRCQCISATVCCSRDFCWMAILKVIYSIYLWTHPCSRIRNLAKFPFARNPESKFIWKLESKICRIRNPFLTDKVFTFKKCFEK